MVKSVMKLGRAVLGFIDPKDSGVESAFGLVMNKADELHFSDEEKEHYKGAAMAAWIEAKKIEAQEVMPRSLRRFQLAMLIVRTLLAAFVVCVVLLVRGHDDVVGKIVELADVWGIAWAFSCVVVCYYGPHLVDKLPFGKRSS